jgi:cystinosin
MLAIFQEDDEGTVLYWLSHIIGWIYFAAWSVSFYGQVIENYNRKSVHGLSFDFEVYNLTGFTGYTIYTVWGYIQPGIGTGTVEIQDIAFAGHAVLITIVTIFQIFQYYDKNDPTQKVSKLCITINLLIWWGIFNIILVERILGLYDPANTEVKFNSIIYMGWCKVFISLIKYIPQAVFNYKRKSTVGWSIMNILLDFTGGSFSFAQNFIDSYRNQFSVSGTLNIAKYALSIISMFFDIIFMIQHYCLYGKNREDRKFDNLVNTI